MNQKLTAGVFVLLGLLCVAADKPERHVEKEGGFSLVPPKGWETKDQANLKYKIFVGPVTNGVASNLVLVDEAYKGELADYVALNKKSLRAAFKDYKEISEKELKTDGGATFYRVIAEIEHNGVLMRQGFAFFDLGGGKKLVITCTAAADGGAKLDGTFETVLKSFQLEKK